MLQCQYEASLIASLVHSIATAAAQCTSYTASYSINVASIDSNQGESYHQQYNVRMTHKHPVFLCSTAFYDVQWSQQHGDNTRIQWCIYQLHRALYACMMRDNYCVISLGLTLPYLTGKACYHPVLRPLLELLANFKSELGLWKWYGMV